MSVTSKPTKELISQCHDKLLQQKAELLNQFNAQKSLFSEREFKGDEIDMSSSLLQENQMHASQGRIRTQLIEIEFALARIENGQYGLCEETEEYIEHDRLLAIPWTRLSIEGAEIRESAKIQRAR
ncbi:MAG: TraR/DksA family transcriptional regulator [Bdellovibrionales bacterium]|nr:TraR/DksA family transcriptional regulator [Bdellovibrionales bacterium]